MENVKRTRLRLRDGRDLDVFDGGPEAGTTLVFHHGTPGACVPSRALAGAARRHGLRFVSASRPGYADSTRRPGRSVADVAADTAEVLDALGIEHCLVAGWSGGGPHALACGALLPDRVAAVQVLSCLAPYPAEGIDWMAGMGEDNVVEFGRALEGETALRPFLSEMGEQLRQAKADDLTSALASLLPPVDTAVLAGEIGEDLAASFREGFRAGIDGELDDDLAFAKPWGFALGDVAVPTLLWQGSDDRAVPYAHGRWLAERIPGVVAHLQEGEGHFSIAIGHIDQILDELLAVGKQSLAPRERL